MNLLLIKYLLKIYTYKFVKGIAQCQTDLKKLFFWLEDSWLNVFLRSFYRR